MDPPDPILVDARGHRCPVPALRLRRALETAADGARVRLLADDPLALIDVPLLLRELNYSLENQSKIGSALIFDIVKRAVGP